MNQRSFARCFRSLAVLGAILIPTAAAFADDPDLTGHKIVRVGIETAAQIEQIHALDAFLLSEGEGLGQVDYVVAPESMPALDRIGVAYVVLADDVQRLIDEERARLAGQGPVDPHSHK